jgi:hypothetical protein
MATTFFVLSLFFLSASSLHSETENVTEPDSNKFERVEQLGEEFQRLMPWSRRTPQSDTYYDTPQPKEYFSTPEIELPQKDADYQYMRYPLCYNPYNRLYEYCYSRDSNYFKLRFRSPEFRFWWKSGRGCPAGFYFVPGSGCYKY